MFFKIGTVENLLDRWNRIKKNLSKTPIVRDRFPKEGEVWVSILGENIGFEQNGEPPTFSRPVLIVKKFNNQMFWCIPLSSQQKNFDFYYNFTDPDGRDVPVILAQIRLLSIKRLVRNIYKLNEKNFRSVKQRLKEFL